MAILAAGAAVATEGAETLLAVAWNRAILALIVQPAAQQPAAHGTAAHGTAACQGQRGWRCLGTAPRSQESAGARVAGGSTDQHTRLAQRTTTTLYILNWETELSSHLSSRDGWHGWNKHGEWRSPATHTGPRAAHPRGAHPSHTHTVQRAS